MDILLLAPGIHYQQAAEDLVKGGGATTAKSLPADGSAPTSYTINNAATLQYIQKVWRADKIVTVDVGLKPPRAARRRFQRQDAGPHATLWKRDDEPDMGWASDLLYLASPVLTVAAMVFMILLADCE